MVELGYFKSQIITAIASSPIVYIPHYDLGYIEDVLISIVAVKDKGELRIFNLDENSGILRYDEAVGLINLITREYVESDMEPDLKRTLESFVLGKVSKNRVEFNGPEILLLSNVFPQLQKQEIQSLLQIFCKLYERGQYSPEMTIIVTGIEPVSIMPPIFERLCTVIEIPIPEEPEIRAYIEELSKDKEIISEQLKYDVEGAKLEIVKTLQGLNFYELKQILKASLCRTGYKISSQTVRYALEEKKQIVRKTGIIEVVDSDVTLAQIGGLGRLIDDIKRKQIIFQNLTLSQSKDVRLPLPKGILILGMPGCGKSMIAKAIANAFNVSLLRLDINRLMGQYVGQSEENLRRALQAAEAAHPCVLWIDEIEKAFAGIDGGNNDIILRLLGHFLTWMQERKTAVYIVATANDALRPELMRKGRFDDVYFVDFPDQKDSLAILKKKLSRYSNMPLYDLSAITENEQEDIVKSMMGQKYGGFSGAEIECVVNRVIEKAFISIVESRKMNNIKSLPYKITKQDFITEIESMKATVMSNQSGDKASNTQVERILKLKSLFIPASYENSSIS